jgi:hypothetical protein
LPSLRRKIASIFITVSDYTELRNDSEYNTYCDIY